jgi:hypothetical protein
MSINMDDELKEGLSPEATVDAFAASCNRDADRLFITEGWFAPFAERLSAALPPALSSVVVEALRDALYKRRSLADVVDFVEQQPMTWPRFEEWRAERNRQAHAALALNGFFPWEDVDASERDADLQMQHRQAARGIGTDLLPCPGCGTSAADLTWIYFFSPPWTWERLCGRAGWIAVCKPCRMQVNFTCTLMN